MAFLASMDPVTGLMDAGIVTNGISQLSQSYAAAQPFPHVVIDDFMPEAVARQCLKEFDRIVAEGSQKSVSFDRAQERAKCQYSPESLSAPVRQFFYAFNSQPFVHLLERICGIEGLIPDPQFLGGGLHEINNGGHLSVHADFNHHQPLNLERRINLLIYLNEGWRDDYGGQLELWSADMSRCEKSVVPIFNRAVIFDTSSFSNHGNPNPVKHPDGVSRKSIALYYYTATWDGSKREHTTQFRARPDSKDAIDWGVRIKESAADLLPPILMRALRNLKH